MRKFNTSFFLMLFLFLSGIGYSQISSSELLIASSNFLKNKQDAIGISIEQNPQALYNDNTIYAYIVNLNPKGFIIFSPSKDIYPVVGFSFENNFIFDSDFNPLQELLQYDMEKQIDFFSSIDKNSNSSIISENNRKWDLLINENQENLRTDYDVQYGPLLDPTVWGGVNCVDQDTNTIYVGNYFTPNHYSPGCVATAMSQVLHYYNWPIKGIGSHTDNDNSGDSQGSYSANFGNTNYDWANMLDKYKYQPSTDTEQRAMGELAYHCGVAVDMDYENTGSTSNINRTPDAYDNYFRFSAHYKTSSWASFWSRFDENIENGHPVAIAVGASNGAGHAPVCDGYREETAGGDRFYHLDMGWWGNFNSWYDIQGSFNAAGYTSVDAAVFDILPDPQMSEPTINSSNNFTLHWNVASNFTWDAFELQESYNGSSWTTIDNNISQMNYTRTVPNSGTYKYRVRAKSDGHYYLDSYSESIEIQILQSGEVVFLSFDGSQKSFFVNDNIDNDLDLSDEWTFETWVKVDNQTINNVWPVIMDRRTVFSMYLITDSDVDDDYAIRFVARSSSGSIIASVRSDNSKQNIHFGDWVHIAVARNLTRASGATRMYINGNEVDSSNDSDFNLSGSTNAVNFGARYWGGYEHYLKGSLDEIRISDISRYNSNFAPDRETMFNSDANTVLLLHLNEGYGLDLTDSADRFNNISLRSNPNDPYWSLEVLPVEFLEELKLSNKSGNVYLTWSTAFEENNKGFEIQHSLTGKTWEKIGFVKPNNPEYSGISRYHFIDTNPYLGINYYRLKQTDNDGASSFSKIRSIYLDLENNDIQVFPNPTNGNIKFYTQESPEQLELISIDGRKFKIEIIDENFIDISHLESGIYILSFTIGDKIYTRKIIKQ